MKTAILNIKIDPKIKKDATKIADDLGFSLSALVNASLKRLIREKNVSFSLLEPSDMLKKVMVETKNDRLKGKNVGPFTNAKDLMASLRS